VNTLLQCLINPQLQEVGILVAAAMRENNVSPVIPELWRRIGNYEV